MRLTFRLRLKNSLKRPRLRRVSLNRSLTLPSETLRLLKAFPKSADLIRQESTRAADQLKRSAKDSEIAMQRNSENAQASLAASIAASKLDHRAWFGISDFKVLEYDPDDPRKPFRFEILFQNSGNTPARNITELGIFQVYNTDFSGPTDGDWKTFTEYFRGVKERYIAAPHVIRKSIVDSSMSAISNDFMIRNYPAIKQHTLFLYYFGQATYLDIDNELHTTKFCLVLSQPENKQFAHCGKGNEMD